MGDSADGVDGRRSDAESVLGSPAAHAARGVAGDILGTDPASVDLGEAVRLSGGASRLTYLLEPRPLQRSGAAHEIAEPRQQPRLIVQMERPGSAGANVSMGLQASLLQDAATVGVPVPEVLAAGGEPGAGFVVLEWIEGEAVVPKVMRDDSLAEVRADLARQAGIALAAVHRMNADAHAELPFQDPLETMRALLDLLGEPHPAFEMGLGWLEEHRPDPGPRVVTHGDFRMGNLLISSEGISALLDWELAHKGSAAEDLGWFCCRAWRFGSPARAGGVGSAEDLLAGYAEGGGSPPSLAELDWWEAYGTLRWGLICVLQASVHLSGRHRSVELAAIGRRAAECEEDLLAIIAGPYDYEPPRLSDDERIGAESTTNETSMGRPTAAELLEAVSEYLGGLPDRLDASAAFESKVALNVVSMVRREALLSREIQARGAERAGRLGNQGPTALAARIRELGWAGLDADLISAVRGEVRDKLAVSNPGYWLGDR
ncbi:MAG: phosphotransferase family protein [Microthrixaceae bacterium]